MNGEKKEFLKREEIRTMGKDLFKLREEEAKKERERIVGLKTEEKKIEEKTQPQKPAKRTLPAFFLRPVFQKLSTSEKIFIRVVSIIIIILVLALIFTFWSWYSSEMKKVSLVPSSPTPEPTITPTLSPSPEETGVSPTPLPSPFTPSIVDRILTFGYKVPSSPRLIDTILIYSSYNTLGGDVYDIEKVIEEFEKYKVTTHYLIARDGTIYRLAPEEAISYHAGSGIMPDGSRKNIINNFSIGIELIYTKEESPSEIQYQALAYLVKNLRQQYNIPSQNILGHKDIKPNKDDPCNFDWDYFRSLLQ